MDTHQPGGLVTWRPPHAESGTSADDLRTVVVRASCAVVMGGFTAWIKWHCLYRHFHCWWTNRAGWLGRPNVGKTPNRVNRCFNQLQYFLQTFKIYFPRLLINKILFLNISVILKQTVAICFACIILEPQLAKTRAVTLRLKRFLSKKWINVCLQNIYKAWIVVKGFVRL